MKIGLQLVEMCPSENDFKMRKDQNEIEIKILKRKARWRIYAMVKNILK